MTDPDFEPDLEGLRRAVELIAEHAARAGDPLPDGGPSPSWPDSLPDTGVGGLGALEALAPAVLGSAARLGHPGYFGHMDPPTPWPSWAGALWAASLNQNLLHHDAAPVARELERSVVGWLAPFFGMDGGHLLPGSSLATLTGLWAARELRGVRTVVASELAHLSVRKAAALLGLELVELPAGREDHRMRVSRLDPGRAALVLTAGTVASGAIDPLDAFPGAAWRHVDAAWAGPLRLSERHTRLLDGIERADSVGFSAHKWLFQPKESAAVMFRDSAAAHDAISYSGGYLAAPNVGLLGSHGASALPLALTLLAWGRQGTARRIESCMELAQRLAERVQSEPRLELFGPSVTGVVLWRPTGVPAAEVQARMQGAFVSLSTVHGETWLRSVSANPNADPDLVVDALLAALR
jgi:L-2,4-diaminobutyrate decarboxylase